MHVIELDMLDRKTLKFLYALAKKRDEPVEWVICGIINAYIEDNK